ncbi:hypothetical protein VKT23_020620 [Stygiomarasmius scandens]|uniref:Uncharacterized protein n=1 Tax=Marasmiellus scandens TaxID=2682957 RepID=A0ABR1IIN1_9AGAR
MGKEPAKRGAPSQLNATRQEWVDKKLAVYLGVTDCKAKTRWLNEVIEDWFHEFPYHLQDEPEEFHVITYLESKSGAPSLGSNATPSTVSGSTSVSLSTTEQTGVTDKYERQLRAEARATITKDPAVRKAIRGWFTQKRLQANNTSGVRNPFSNWFAQIKGMGRETTRSMTDYQWYLKSEKYGPRVKEEFEKKWSGMGKEEKYRLYYLCEMAKEMLELESDEVKEELRSEIEADHELKLERAEKLMSGEEISEAASQSPMVKDTCQKHVGLVAQPMVDILNSHTDYCTVLLCGRAPRPGENKFDLAVYSSGTTVPKDGQKGLKIHEFQPHDFKMKMLNYFMDFLVETVKDSVPPEETGTVAPDPADDPTLLSFEDDKDSPSTSTRNGASKGDNGDAQGKGKTLTDRKTKGKGKKGGRNNKEEKKADRERNDKGKEKAGKSKRKGKGKEKKGAEDSEEEAMSTDSEAMSTDSEAMSIESKAVSTDSETSADKEAEAASQPPRCSIRLPEAVSQPSCRSLRLRPTPTSLETFVEGLPKDWLPLTVTNALKRLPAVELKKVMKTLQLAADTQDVLKFNSQVQAFAAEYHSYMVDEGSRDMETISDRDDAADAQMEGGLVPHDKDESAIVGATGETLTLTSIPKPVPLDSTSITANDDSVSMEGVDLSSQPISHDENESTGAVSLGVHSTEIAIPTDVSNTPPSPTPTTQLASQDGFPSGVSVESASRASNYRSMTPVLHTSPSSDQSLTANNDESDLLSHPPVSQDENEATDVSSGVVHSTGIAIPIDVSNTVSPGSAPPTPATQLATSESQPSLGSQSGATSEAADSRSMIPILHTSPSGGNQDEASDSAFSLDRTGWPSWMHAAGEYLEGTLSDIQGVEDKDLFQRLLQEWSVFERWHGYENPKNASYGSIGRPACIGVWFKSSHKFRDLTPKERTDSDMGNISLSWPLWWSAINPDWRLRDDDHIIVLGKEEKGDWSTLDKHGPCGLLSVIMSLIWWAKSDIADKTIWSKAVEDVLLAVHNLNKGNRTQGVRRKRTEVTEEEPEPKRRQTRSVRT